MGRLVALVAGLMLTFAATAAAAPAFTSSFTKPAPAALKALRATVGKPFDSGYVFVDGRYLPPPYTVERFGTVLRINGVQISSEIVPWSEFVKTQAGAVATKSEAPVEEPAAAEPEPEPEPEEEEEVDDSESSLDDLFDDDPAPKPKKPVVKKRKPAARPKPKKPAVTVSYSFDGEFTPNEKTKVYLEKINAARTRIDKHLRAGGYYCFGSRYAAVSGDAGAAKHLMEKLPEVMRDNSASARFAAAVQSAGFVYLPQALVADLYRNRFVYPELLSRRKKQQEDAKWESILGGGR